MYYVYLIYSKEKNLRYVGSTNDISRRLKEHNSGRSKFTSVANDWKCIYYKEFQSEDLARKFERRIKKNKKYRQIFYKESKLGLPV